ncbi:MAG: glycoside hydrolase family 16 protein [Roseibacillus sp.]
MSLCLLSGFSLSLNQALGQEIPGWDLVWSDEFTQADGTGPDSSKWGYDIGRGSNGWGNAELQYYTSRTDNARIENNELVIEVRQENNYANSGANYTSARLLTQDKWDWTYGRFEARIKVPSGSGLWPACWMLGNNIDTVSWPQCGEIDIMEFVGRLPQEIFGTIHGPGYAGGASFGNIYDFGFDVADDYHVYVVEWEEDLIRWYVDGILYHTAEPSDVAPNEWVFDHGQFMLLNVAVGGNFGGTLDPAVTFPKQMLVDYVRVYAAEGDGNVLMNPGLESGDLSSWTPYDAAGANDPGAFVESTSSTYYNGGNGGGDNVLTHSGTYVAKVFGDFIGAENFNGFYQDVAAAPDTTWSAGGFALTHPQDLMSGNNTAWLEVSFRDGSGTVLGLYRSDVLTSANVTPGAWMALSVSNEIDPNTFAVLGTTSELEAPAGTTMIRFQTVYRQDGGNDGGSMYFDDLSLVEIVVVPLEACFEKGTLLEWTAGSSSSTYQPQTSLDGLSWDDLGDIIVGDSVTSFFAAEEAAFYQVIETTSGTTGNGVQNPGFEVAEAQIHPSVGATQWTIAGAEDTDPSNGLATMTAESSYSTFTPRSGSRMLVFESTTPPAPAGVNAPYSDVRSAHIDVDGDTSYELSFYAAHVMKIGGANPQVNIRFYNSGGAYVGDAGFESFSSLGSTWTEVTKTFTAPAEAAFAEVSWIQALGAGNDWHWVTLIDDVEILTDNLPGTDTVLPTVVEEGYQISWPSVLGRNYQVTSSADLIDFTTVEGSFTGDGTMKNHAGAANEPQRFFRVEEVVLP